MAHNIIELECPGCATPITISTKKCPTCFREIVISTFNSVYDMGLPEINKYASVYRKVLSQDPDNKDVNLSMAFCYLKLKLHDKALFCFEKAIEDNFDNSESFFYAAVALLKGKPAFLSNKATIVKVEEYIQAAIMIEPRAVYTYFHAYIKYDYYYKKRLRSIPSYNELLLNAQGAGISKHDVEQLYALLAVQCPTEIYIGAISGSGANNIRS